jgi:Flp pilus assembly protein TadD
MIVSLLAAATLAAGPVAGPSAHDLLAGAEYAIHAGRLGQGALMIARAVGAGAHGRELDRALADLAFRSGRYADALGGYEALLKSARPDGPLLEAAGIAALKLGKKDTASPLLEQAVKSRGTSWRAWNALGVLADDASDWKKADDCYERASQMAPGEVAPVSNRGWSLLLRGEWDEAVAYFEHAAAIDPRSKRVANNLELARSALASDLPRRRVGESGRSWAERLNDAGVAAAVLGDNQRATTAFTQALEASDSWYERAANNLEAFNRR